MIRAGFELTGGLGGLNPPTSTFQTHYFSKNIDLIDKKPCSTPPPHLLTIRPLDKGSSINVVTFRGREGGQTFVTMCDEGEGVLRNVTIHFFKKL